MCLLSTIAQNQQANLAATAAEDEHMWDNSSWWKAPSSQQHWSQSLFFPYPTNNMWDNADFSFICAAEKPWKPYIQKQQAQPIPGMLGI